MSRRSSVAFGSFADVDQTKEFVESALGVTFTTHSSDHRGGDYWLRSTGREGESLLVQANAELDGPIEPVDVPTIVYVESTDRPEEVRASLDGFNLLFVQQADWPT